MASSTTESGSTIRKEEGSGRPGIRTRSIKGLNRLARELNSETRKQKRDAARMIASDRFDTSRANDDENAQREFDVTPKMKKALDNAISKITASRMRFVARKLIYSLMPMDEFLKRYPSYTKASAKSYKSKAVKIIKDDLKRRKEWSEKRKKKVAKK